MRTLQGRQQDLASTDSHTLSTPVYSSEIQGKWYFLLAVFLAATAIVFSRSPIAFLHPQLLAEDGHVWYADAYNHGWLRSLLWTQDGYFQTFTRLAAAMSLLVPMSYAPLVMNLVGLAVQIAPAILLCSSRMSRWGTFRVRAALGLAYLAMPNCREMNLTITQGQWHLALLACLLLFADSPRTQLQRYADLATFALCGVTGPFVILLVPVSAIYLRYRRERWLVTVTSLLLVGATLQAYVLLVIDRHARNHWPLGANPEWFIRITGGQVFLAGIVGKNSAAVVSFSIVATAFIIGVLVIAGCLRRLHLEGRLFLLYALLLYVASLASPMVNKPPLGWSVWSTISAVSGIRYWFFPTLAFVWCVIWMMVDPIHGKNRRGLSITLAFLMTIGVVRDWRHQDMNDLQFAAHVSEFSRVA